MTYTKKQQQAINMFNHYKMLAVAEYEKIFKDLRTPSMYEIQNKLQNKYEINDDIMEIINKYYMKNKNQVNIKFFNENKFKYERGKGLMLTIQGTSIIPVLKVNPNANRMLNQIKPNGEQSKFDYCYYNRNDYIYTEKETNCHEYIDEKTLYKSDMLNINGFYFTPWKKPNYKTRDPHISYKKHMTDFTKDDFKRFLDKHNIEYKKSDSKHGLVCRLIGENPKNNKYTADMKNMCKITSW